jgi:hypothetical protein
MLRNDSVGNNLSRLFFLFLFLSPFVFAQTPSGDDSELTLSEFRALLAGVPESARAEAAFFELLVAQGRAAAAHQSLDRLAGWTKAAQARLDAESAPLLDVEMLRFAEARAEVRVERLEAERRSALSKANRLLGREPSSPLIAVNTTPAAKAPAPGVPSAAARIARLEQLLPQAQELLARIYQNYLFGGAPLTALLWQEEQTYQTDLQYRLLLVEAEQSRAPAASEPRP